MTDDPGTSQSGPGDAAAPDPMETAGLSSAQVALSAYHRCHGDLDAMTDLLMETFIAGAARQMQGAPPVEIRGQQFDAAEVLRALVRCKVREVAELIEAHNLARH